jgi:hypothetical protein
MAIFRTFEFAEALDYANMEARKFWEAVVLMGLIDSESTDSRPPRLVSREVTVE